MGEVFAGRYELVDVLGHGGMGDVWRVWDRRDDCYRAAKLLRQVDGVSLMRFVRESTWRIEHPHVVVPSGWVGEDDRVLFTMPLVRGGSVATVLADHGTVPWWWARDVLRQVLDALEAVHEAGLVHRDVKPANILLDATGVDRPHAYLSDFGIAVHRDDPRLTRASETFGTRGYQAPEVLAGEDPQPSHDLYAVGVLARDLLGSLPADSALARLVDPDPRYRLSAARVRAALDGLSPFPVQEQRAEPVEVFDQVPELPCGWGPGGPVTAPPAVEPEGAPSPRRPRPARAPRTRRTVPRDVLVAVGLAAVGVALLVGAFLAL